MKPLRDRNPGQDSVVERRPGYVTDSMQRRAHLDRRPLRVSETSAVSRLTDADWLRRRLDKGYTTAQIAGEAGTTQRAVRMAVRRHGLHTDREAHFAAVDVAGIVQAYRAGERVPAIAERHRVSDTWIRRRLAADGVERRTPPHRPVTYSRLDDRRWLLERIAAGRGLKRIAQELGCSPGAVRAALRRHSITLPPRDADPVERLTYIDDDEIRAEAAARIERDALRLAERARRHR